MTIYEINQKYIEDMDLTVQLINHQPGRMQQMAMLQNSSANEIEDFGDGDLVNKQDIAIVGAVYRNPGITNALLCDFFGRTKGAISHLTNSVEKKGYIRREPNPADAKSSLFFVTARGSNLIQKILKRDKTDPDDVLIQLLGLCSLEDIQTFYRVCDIYTSLLMRRFQNKSLEKKNTR